MNGIDQDKAYWLRQLAELPPVPKLPWDKEPPPVSSFIRETVSVQILSVIWGWVKSLAERLGATPQAAVLAVFQTLLYRYTGQTDLITGAVLSPPAGCEVVALRTRLTGGP